MTDDPSTTPRKRRTPKKESKMATGNYTLKWTSDPLPASLVESYPRKWAALRKKCAHMLTPEWQEEGRPWLTVLLADRREANLAVTSAKSYFKSQDTNLIAHRVNGRADKVTVWIRPEDPRDKFETIYS